MKKLMCAVAAIAAGVAMADGEITSANVVGFNKQVNTENQSVIFGVQFANVGSGETIPFDKLITTAVGFEDDDAIQVSGTDQETGLTKLTDYYYYTEETQGEAGWYNESYEHVGDVEGLKNGQSAWFMSGSPKELTTAGQVNKGHYIHTYTDSATLTSSAYPGAFCPNAANVTWSVEFEDDDSIQVAYKNPETGLTALRDYYFYTEETQGEEGWYNESYELLDADFAITAAGEGFWLLLGNTDATFTEVSPLGNE